MKIITIKNKAHNKIKKKKSSLLAALVFLYYNSIQLCYGTQKKTIL